MGRDTGLFGPGSVTWRVHRHPAMLVGGMRALILQALHPLALAGVIEHSDFRAAPLRRLRRTAEYVTTTTFADTATAREAGARVRRMHSRVRGIDAVTGRPYSATDPETLLWVHCVEVHSFLAAFRAYGGGLSRADADAYLAESTRSAELVGIDPAAVPQSTEAMRAYFAAIRTALCVSVSAREAIDFIVAPPLTRELAPYAPTLRVASSAAVGLVPRELRRLAGIDRSWPADALTYAAVAPALRVASTALRLPYADRLMPTAAA